MNCPKCRKKIEYVYALSECEQTADIDESGHVKNWSAVDHIGKVIHFFCPYCDEQIDKSIKE